MLPHVSCEHLLSLTLYLLAVLLEYSAGLDSSLQTLVSTGVAPSLGSRMTHHYLKLPFPVSCIMGKQPGIASGYVFLSQDPFIIIFGLGFDG